MQRLLAEMQLFSDAAPHQPWLIEMMTSVMTKNQEITQAATGLPAQPPPSMGPGIAEMLVPSPTPPRPGVPMRGITPRPAPPNPDELARLLGPGGGARGPVASPLPVMPAV